MAAINDGLDSRQTNMQQGLLIYEVEASLAPLLLNAMLYADRHGRGMYPGEHHNLSRASGSSLGFILPRVKRVGGILTNARERKRTCLEEGSGSGRIASRPTTDGRNQ